MFLDVIIISLFKIHFVISCRNLLFIKIIRFALIGWDCTKDKKPLEMIKNDIRNN